jgi:hypothetical protein
LQIQTLADATEFLEAVHYFHDGFIESVALRSQDAFDVTDSTMEGVGHICSGAFSVKMRILHHPTISGLPPRRLASRFDFENVRGFFLDLRHHQAEEWPLQEIRIDADPDSTQFRLLCSWHRLLPKGQWTTQQVHLFSFSKANVETVDVG